ncbi:MAG: zinc-ribbon domain-containing protein [Deltaproteobacteria bacterium]|nr:zinc-ribbon domain-containing protein [Deltaproteobacteria bacterium]
MKISCPSCQSKYTIADEKVQGRSVKVRCRKCGETIHVTSAGASIDTSGAAPTADAASDTGGGAFSVLIAEGDQRDMTIADIVAGYNSGVVTADTYVWGEGQSDWMPLGQVSAIVEAINAASAAVDAAREAARAPEPEAPAPAAAPEPAPAPAPVADLFGNAPAAAQSLQTSHEPAAVREDRRRDVDLFGARRASDDEVATSAPTLGSVVAAGGPATGTRDESSVLFSLSALTSATPQRASAPSNGGSTSPSGKDDSGLIDLKALALKAEAPKATAAPVAASILDAAPLLGTPLIDVPPTQGPDVETKKSKAPLFIGIGIAVAGVAIAVAVFIGTRKPAVVPVPAASVAPTATASETAAAPTTTDSSGAAPPSTGAPSATAKTPVKGGPAPKGTGKGKGTAGPGETSAPPPTATAKAPPKSKCGCAPTDLACNMACAAK